MDNDKSGKSPSENFAEMMKDFGSAVAEIFNDPQLKEKAREFGESASNSAKTFASRFKDEEVKKKFSDLGQKAKEFGNSVADYFKDDSKKNEKSGQASGEDKDGQAQSSGTTAEKTQDNNKIISNDNSKKNTPAGPVKVSVNAERERNARITGYCFAIAWSIIFFVFFNFFNKYIAYYVFDSASQAWTVTPFITEMFSLWLPFLNASLLVSVAGNIVLIINDSFYFENITNIVMHIFGLASISALLIIFPFDFNVMSPSVLATILTPIIRISLIVILVGLSIAILVRFIKVIIKTARSS
ncbi:MAG: hypothetical protein JW997_03920 [Actinobacteria bacterium]|nr:hypothetical protein [Actinomycetota bacterium]